MSNDAAFFLDDFKSPRSAYYIRRVRPPASSITGRELQERSCSAISLVVHIELRCICAYKHHAKNEEVLY